jgi:nitronate monooxygenase
MPLPEIVQQGLRLPVIAAPMFLVSGPDLVIAACRSGVIGSFPTANCRTMDELDEWLERISLGSSGHAIYAPNLIVHRTNSRLLDDLQLVVKYKAPMVIASVGRPDPILHQIHDYGGLVFADVASMRHARLAIESGVDGLILLTAGAGGQTGWANPFAFVRAVREIYSGPIVMAGGIADAKSLQAAMVLGCDLAYMGTRFIATRESMARDSYKDMLVTSSLDDIILTKAVTGLETNMLKPSLIAAGLDLDELAGKDVTVNKDTAALASSSQPRQWKDVWSAGHTVSQVTDVQSVKELVDELVNDWGPLL